ncbi:MAG: ABC transporter ATP-binding protein [Oscillospiraceae bacterium]|nr:ABC transporter ATP-binding protein [Oscillospiraceae bacterium]
MIDIKNLSIAYGGESVIENFSLHVEKGGRIALMGPSGCGKTSLMNAVCGILKPQKGSVSVDGKLSCVFQEPRLLPWLSALENVNAVLSDSAATMPETRKWLEAVGLGGNCGKLPSELSGGMQQRLAIARALAYGGDILLLDEPLKGMDPETEKAVTRLILESSEGRTLMLITHDEAEAEAFADQIYVYRDKKFELK